MTDHLCKRIAEKLGWTESEVQSFSLPTLRELVRGVSPKLAYEITQVMNSREYFFEAVPRKRVRS
jgi:hypothetical protein